MRESTQMSIRGLFFLLLVLGIGSSGLNAQVLNGINDAVKTATEPAKDATKVVKAVSQPAKDVNKATKTVTDAPNKVVKEYDKLGNEIDKTKGEYEKTVDRLDGNGGDKKNPKASDSTSTKADTVVSEDPTHKTAIPEDFKPEARPVPTPEVVKKPVDPMSIPRPIPPGSKDNKTASGPLPIVEATVPDVKVDDKADLDARTAAVGTDPDGKGHSEAADTTLGKTDAEIVLGNPIGTDTLDENADALSEASSAESSPNLEAAMQPEITPEPQMRLVALRTVPLSGQRRPKPDYSHSPARIALEKAEFDVETLEELFRYSNWDGPEREHTVRSVAQSLDELQQAIVEIRKLDPGQSTWRFDEAYKDMKAAYIGEMKRQK